MLNELRKQQKEHTKISYNRLEIQKYLNTHMLNNHEVLLLFSLRSRNAKQFKANFPCNEDQICPMEGCDEIDTQEHCLKCPKTFLVSTHIVITMNIMTYLVKIY